MKIIKFLSIILTSIMSFGIYSIAFATENISEGCTPIYTAEDLNNIRNDLDGKYILMNHINLSEYTEWNEIGDYGSPFTGEINGDGYSIIGLKTSGSLLGWIENATVKNLGIVDCEIIQPKENADTSSLSGAIANNAKNSTFNNCYVSGIIQPCVRAGLVTLISSCNAGGLVGKADNCSFVNCYNNADINFTYDKISLAKIGGLVGESSGTTFECCYNTGSIVSMCTNEYSPESKNVYIGGLVGNAEETTSFKYCYYKNNLTYAVGKSQENPVGTKSLTDLEIKNQNSYVGFEFENIWTMATDYPVLKTSKVFIKNEIKMNYKDCCSVFENRKTEIISWETTNEKIAIINEDGNAEAVGVGTTTINIKTSDGQSKNITVSVSYTFWQKIIVYLFFGWIWY